MKKGIYLTSILLLSFSIGVIAQNRSIKFEHGTWQEVKDKAAKENKLIFMDCFTSWCGPCKWMAKNTFANDTVADYFNEHFVCAKFDMEAGEGKDIAKQFTVNAYPTFLFIDAKGNMVHRSCGARPVKNFMATANDARTPEKTYSVMVKKFESGTRDASFMKDYLNTTAEAGLSTKEGAKAYFATQKESDLINRENWMLMYKYLKDMESREFKYLLTNSNSFEQKYTDDTVEQVISRVYGDTCYHIIYSKTADKKKYLEMKEVIKKSGFKGSEKLLLNTDLAYYEKQGDWDNYAKTAVPLIEKYYIKNAGMINNTAYVFFEHVSDKQMLTKATEWSKKGNEIDPNDPASMDTYACLLFKTGNKQEAIKIEEKAMSLAKAAGEDTADFEKQLAEFKNDNTVFIIV